MQNLNNARLHDGKLEKIWKLDEWIKGKKGVE